MKLKNKPGFTIVEAVVTVGILSVVSILIMTIFNDLNDTHLAKTSEGWMQQADQKGLNQVSRDIAASRVFIGRRLGEAANATASYSKYYLNKINLSGTFNVKGTIDKALNSNILPVIEEATQITTMASYPERVGNSILVGVFDDSVTISWAGVSGTQSGAIDLISLRYYFLARGTNSNNNNVHLLRWSSAYFADYTQVNNILAAIKNTNGTQQTNFLNALKASNILSSYNKRPVSIAGIWKVEEKSDVLSVNRFYKFTHTAGALDLDATIGGTSGTIPNFAVMEVTNSANLSNYSISRNNTFTDLYRKVPKFGTASSTGDGFPNGFEVMFTGQTGLREVFVRLVSESLIKGTRKVYNQSTILSTGKDS